MTEAATNESTMLIIVILKVSPDWKVCTHKGLLKVTLRGLLWKLVVELTLRM
jgi:hypothetical protein